MNKLTTEDPEQPVNFATGTPDEKAEPEPIDSIEETQQIWPDILDRSICDIMARYSKHGDYDFLPTTDTPFDIYHMCDNMKHVHKLDGFYGINFTASLKLVWNSDPFVQGIYMMAYLPPGPLPEMSLIGTENVLAYAATYFSGCPRVIFNINTSSSATLDIPYIGPQTFVTMETHEVPLLGHIYVVPISPAKGPECFTKLGYTAYFAMKNLRTIGVFPANADFVQDTFAALSSEEIVMQAPEAITKSKTVSSFLGSTKNFLDSFGDMVPTASSVTKPLSWLSGGAQKIADFLGYSKPFSVNALKPVANVPYADQTTADATFVGAKMAMNSDAGVLHYDLSGRGVDEMNIATILSRPEVLPYKHSEGKYQPFVEWSTTDVVGTKLWEHDVSPSAMSAVFKATSEPTNREVYIHTHMSYLSTLFSKWRGSINFSIRFASTGFQTGRLRIVFTPKSARNPDLTMLPYTYSQIVDIADPSSWDFEIPFLSGEVWHEVDQPSGYFHILVERPLLAACSVVQHVDMTILVRAGKTFEFACPFINTRHIPVVNFKDKPNTMETIEMQAPSLESLTTMMLPKTKYFEYETDDSISLALAPRMETKSSVAHALAVGDPVRSMRAVLKKFWLSSDPVWTAGTNQHIANYPTPVFLLSTANKNDMDMISRTSLFYAFWRGGFRYSAQNYFPCRVYTYNTNRIDNDLSFAAQGRLTLGYNQVGSFAAVGTIDPSKFELPYTSNTVCKNLWFSPIKGEKELTVLAFHYYLGDAGVIVTRAVADDFQFGCMIGAPVTYVVTA